MRGLAAVVICLTLVGCAGSGPVESDWQRAQAAKSWQEERVALPPYPKRANLIEFDPGLRTDFRFFVDSASLSVGSDGVVRYVLVARSLQGAENVSFEGLRCSNSEYRIYATGGSDGGWIKTRDSRWRAAGQRASRWHQTLANDYFCPGKSPIGSVAEGVEALRTGGNARSDSVRNRSGG